MSCDISNLRPEEAHRTYCWAAAASDRQSIFPSKCLEVSNRISIDRSNTKYRRLPIWHSTRMQPKIYHRILSWPFFIFCYFLVEFKAKTGNWKVQSNRKRSNWSDIFKTIWLLYLYPGSQVFPLLQVTDRVWQTGCEIFQHVSETTILTMSYLNTKCNISILTYATFNPLFGTVLESQTFHLKNASLLFLPLKELFW